MSNIFKATKYQLMMFIPQGLICLSIIALNILISVTITYLFPGSGVSAGSSDLIVLIWLFIIGLLSFIVSFRFMLANAVSRKSFFWANILYFAITSVVCATAVTLLFSFIRLMNIKIMELYILLYKDNTAMGTAIWFFGALFLLLVLGWFISMLYYRSNKLMAFVISLAPFVVSGLLTIINQATKGALFDSMTSFVVTAMGFSGNIPNPYMGSISMLLLSVIISIFNYLLIRRAQIKE